MIISHDQINVRVPGCQIIEIRYSNGWFVLVYPSTLNVVCQSSSQEFGVLPIVVNNNNFARGHPTMLSFDDTRTLFHEFGKPILLLFILGFILLLKHVLYDIV